LFRKEEKEEERGLGEEAREKRIKEKRDGKSVEEHEINTRAEGGGSGGEAALW
jgi:hypothetical protein